MSIRCRSTSNMRPSTHQKRPSSKGPPKKSPVMEQDIRKSKSYKLAKTQSPHTNPAQESSGRNRQTSVSQAPQSDHPTSTVMGGISHYAPGHATDANDYYPDADLYEMTSGPEQYGSHSYMTAGPAEGFHGPTLFSAENGFQSCAPYETTYFDPHCTATYGSALFSADDGDASPSPGRALDSAPFDYGASPFNGLQSQPGCTGESTIAYPAMATQPDYEEWSNDSDELASLPMSATSSSYGFSQTPQSAFVNMDELVIPEESAWPSNTNEVHHDLPFRGVPESLHMQQAAYCPNTSVENHITIKPEVIGSKFLPSPEYGPMENTYPGLTFSLPTPSRRMSDVEPTGTARKDPRYQALPGPDKMYHCPFESEGCKHGPEKLKCNYDKHLDSHLKPYQCNRGSCDAVRFSSTACLLRHEREAHALHGHGDKPYMCIFQDCDRAQPSKGFPRQWNLRDHMKRVHNYVVPDKPQQRGGLPSPPNSPDLTASSSRKKKAQELQTRSTGTTRKSRVGSTKTRRDSDSEREALRAQWEKSFNQLSPRQIARLRQCHEEGRDYIQETFATGIY